MDIFLRLVKLNQCSLYYVYESRLFACFFEITLRYSKAPKHLHKTAYDPDKTSIKSPMITVLPFPGALSYSVTNSFVNRDGILKQHFYLMFLGIKSTRIRLEFLTGFLSSFSVVRNAIHEKTRAFLFRIFFRRDFKTREEYGFLQNPQVEGAVIACSKRLESFV
jgi:hypothetical protein